MTKPTLLYSCLIAATLCLPVSTSALAMGAMVPPHAQQTTPANQQAQTIMNQIQQENQRAQAERMRIRQETQQRINQMQQEITGGRTPSTNPSGSPAAQQQQQRQMNDAYMRGGGASGGEGEGGGSSDFADDGFDPGVQSSSDDPVSQQAGQIDRNLSAQMQAAAQRALDRARQIQQQNQNDYNDRILRNGQNSGGSGSGGGSGGGGNDDTMAPPYEGPLFSYEDYLKMPKFVYTATQRDMLYDLLYAPQGEQASRGGMTGYGAALNSSRFGYGPNGSLGGIQGSFGGTYPLLSEIYNAMREINPAGALELARAMSRGGALTGIGDDGLLYITYDPAIKEAIANGLLFNVVGQPGSSSGGFSNVALVLPLLFHIFDFGVEDGDNITLTVSDNTGVRFTNTFNLTNAGINLAPTVNPGQVTITVHANNEGSLSPNTGQIDILSTVLSGSSTQQFNLQTGETGQMVITASP